MIKVCTSGYFNPVHIGHIRLFEEAKSLGDRLIVIVNNDKQVIHKGAKVFMDEKERCAIIRALKCVDEVILSIDDDKTICKTIEFVCPNIFAKGGDSTPDNVPEKNVCERLDIKIIYGVGGNKIQSSSWLKSQL
jgi:cytidyltransferase-like protein